MLWTWSQERNRNISKACVFNFHHSIQHDEAFGCTFYNEVVCPNIISKSSYFEKWNVKLVAPLFSNKIKSKVRIALIENEEIISNDKEIA